MPFRFVGSNLDLGSYCRQSNTIGPHATQWALGTCEELGYTEPIGAMPQPDGDMLYTKPAPPPAHLAHRHHAKPLAAPSQQTIRKVHRPHGLARHQKALNMKFISGPAPAY
eukprot:PhM_4_TR9044/c0_g1_i1/m.59196